MSLASRWTIITRFDDYARENNLAVILKRLGIDDDLGHPPEVQEVIMALADQISKEEPCVIEAFFDGNLQLASVDHRKTPVAV